VSNAEQQAEVPSQVATVVPTGAGHTQAIVKSLEGSIADIKIDVRELKNSRHSDFVYMITVFGAGFLILAGLLGTVYFKLDDRIDRLSQIIIRADTRLEDLLQRIPPVTTPAPKR
jgi:pheromone shutdown protein TraB